MEIEENEYGISLAVISYLAEINKGKERNV
jgi:hypothetical protein